MHIRVLTKFPSGIVNETFQSSFLDTGDVHHTVSVTRSLLHKAKAYRKLCLILITGLVELYRAASHQQFRFITSHYGAKSEK